TNVPAGAILHPVQPAALLRGHLAVGLRAGFGAGDARLLFVEPVRFARRQAARRDALIDARLLIGYTLVDARRRSRGGSLGESADRRKRERDAGAESFAVEHGFPPMELGFGLVLKTGCGPASPQRRPNSQRRRALGKEL
ncbi:MAG: hypothetical protein ABI156_11585, partial [Caldimonas sp.]